MVKRILTLAVAITLTACQQVSPLQESIKREMLNNNRDIKSITFIKCEQLSEITVEQEYNSKKALFTSKKTLEERWVRKYTRERKPTNAAKHKTILAQTNAILSDIEALDISANRDSVLYHTYKVSVICRTFDKQKFQADKFVAVSPELKVLAISEKDDLDSRFYSPLPGYRQILLKHRFKD